MNRVNLLVACVLFLAAPLASVAQPKAAPAVDARFTAGKLLFHDDFRGGFNQWSVESEQPGVVAARDGALVIDVPAGCTVWFKPLIESPVMIEYEAAVVSAGGTNDRVSDLNCFWMARDARSPENIFAHPRSGKFADYNQLRAYYVGLGGNENTTTRFRRYIGDVQLRPLLPEHDLRDPKDLLTANATQSLGLVACGGLIQFYRDGKKLFELNDPKPYRSGWFAFRTVHSHLVIRNFCVHRLEPAPGAKEHSQ